MQNFCANCGSVLKGYEKYCTNCGTQIKKDAPDNKQTVVDPIESSYETPKKNSDEPSFFDELGQFYEPSTSNKNIYHSEYPETEELIDIDGTKTSKKTGTALVLGIMGIVFAFFFTLYGHICSIAGIVFGVNEYKETKKTAGLVLSIIGEVMSLVSSIIGFIIGFNIGFNSAFF